MEHTTLNQNKKRKKILTIVLSLTLVAALAVGGTLAYLFSQTETKENVFTFADNIKGKLDEPKWNPKDAEQLVPGKKIDKDPQLTNNSTNAVTEYGAIRLTFQDGKGVDLSAADTATLLSLITIDWSSKWTLIDGTATSTKQIYEFNNTIPQNVTTDPVFYSVTIKDTVTPAQLKWLAGDYGHTDACYVFGTHDPAVCTITYRHYEKCALEQAVAAGVLTEAQVSAAKQGDTLVGTDGKNYTCDCTPAEVHSPNCPSLIGTIPTNPDGTFVCGHNTLLSGIGNFTIKVEGAVVQADAFTSASDAAADLITLFP